MSAARGCCGMAPQNRTLSCSRDGWQCEESRSRHLLRRRLKVSAPSGLGKPDEQHGLLELTVSGVRLPAGSACTGVACPTLGTTGDSSCPLGATGRLAEAKVPCGDPGLPAEKGPSLAPLASGTRVKGYMASGVALAAASTGTGQGYCAQSRLWHPIQMCSLSIASRLGSSLADHW